MGPVLSIPNLNNILNISISKSQRVCGTNLKMQIQILKSSEFIGSICLVRRSVSFWSQVIKSTIVWVIGMKGSLLKGPSLKDREVLTKVSEHAAGRWGVIPALGVLWTLSSHCLTSRKEKSSKQIKASSESFKWPKKSRSRMSALCFYLWNMKFKQSSPFRIHLAIKIAFQVIICKEVGSI